MAASVALPLLTILALSPTLPLASPISPVSEGSKAVYTKTVTVTVDSHPTLSERDAGFLGAQLATEPVRRDAARDTPTNYVCMSETGTGAGAETEANTAAASTSDVRTAPFAPVDDRDHGVLSFGLGPRGEPSTMTTSKVRTAPFALVDDRDVAARTAGSSATTTSKPVRTAPFAMVDDRDLAAAPSTAAADCPAVILVGPNWTWGPTSTVWTSTATSTSTIDCGGCSTFRPSRVPLGVPPVVFFNATVTAATPTVTTAFECGTPSATVPPTPEALEPRASATAEDCLPGGCVYPDSGLDRATTTATPPGVARPACTTSTKVAPSVKRSTKIEWGGGTVTETRSVDCSACELHWSTGDMYYLMPVRETATLSVPMASTKTDLACKTAETTARG